MGNESKTFNWDFIKIATTALPLVILAYLMCNFIFNAGYFYVFGIRFMSLLTMQDYYEGTAPFIAFIFCFFSGFFNVCMHSIQDVLCFPRIFINYLDSHIYLPLRIIFVKVITKIKLFALRCLKHKITYSKKKAYAEARKELKDIEKDLKSRIAPMSSNLFLEISICVFFIFSPLYYFYKNIFFVDKTMFYLLLGIWVVYAFLLTKLKLIYRIIVTFVALIIFLLFFGIFMSESNIKNAAITVQLKNNDTYQLVRTISRGVIVKDNGFIIKFVPWNDINQISKNIRDKFK